MTLRLYDQDSELLRFTANVVSCEKKNGAYAVVLDRTAFFPEGGGQGADHGFLGGVRVTDVQESGGEVVHTTDAPLSPGQTVEGSVDAQRRMSMMQQHSGEHIFSGLVCSNFGYDNVGFHIGSEFVTMDFNGMLSMEDALRIERMANEVIWKNVPIVTTIPARDELEHMHYRSKKALEGDVRIVSIEGADCCACCGTHVKRTGSVGQIKVLGVQKYKSGVRVSILCGLRALDAENVMLEQLRRSAVALSVKQHETAEAVERVRAERDDLRYQNETLALRLFDMLAAQEAERDMRVVACDALHPGLARKAAGRLCEGARLGLVLIARQGGWSFALSSRMQDVRPATHVLCELFGGRGGGPKDMTQGQLASGKVEEIRAALERQAR